MIFGVMGIPLEFISLSHSAIFISFYFWKLLNWLQSTAKGLVYSWPIEPFFLIKFFWFNKFF
jgi:hypothetical protein